MFYTSLALTLRRLRRDPVISGSSGKAPPGWFEGQEGQEDHACCGFRNSTLKHLFWESQAEGLSEQATETVWT